MKKSIRDIHFLYKQKEWYLFAMDYKIWCSLDTELTFWRVSYAFNNLHNDIHFPQIDYHFIRYILKDISLLNTCAYYVTINREKFKDRIKILNKDIRKLIKEKIE